MCAHNMKLTYKGTSTLADKKRRLTEYNACPEKNQHLCHKHRHKDLGQSVKQRVDEQMVARYRQGQHKAKGKGKDKSETKQQQTIKDKSNRQGVGSSI